MSNPDTLGSAPLPAPEEALPVQGTSTRTDRGLDVLLEVRAQIAPELPEELLRQCYAIQKQFQFDREEQLPLVHTRRLVEAFVEREAEARSTERAEVDE